MADTDADNDNSNMEHASSTNPCMALVKYCPKLADETSKSAAEKSNPASPMATSSPEYVSPLLTPYPSPNTNIWLERPWL